MLQILAAIFGLSLLVIVHEAGHYFAARAFGIRVIRFSIGFGPTIVRYQPPGSPTVFQVCAIPFLAYVMIAGMNPEAHDPGDRGLYANKSLWARLLVNLGGPLANYLTASLLIFALALSGWRVPAPSETLVLAQVEAGSPAATAGLRPGDTIVSANGHAVHDVASLSEQLNARPLESTRLEVERDGQRLSQPLSVKPRVREGRALIGVNARLDVRYEPQPVAQAAKLALTVPVLLTAGNFMGIVDMVRRHSSEGVVGPVGMAKLVVQQADQGAYAYVWILVMISIALGFFNLLPFPGLDGGKLVFLGYELVTRRKPNERVEAVVHTLGLVFLVGLIALVTLRDVVG